MPDPDPNTPTAPIVPPAVPPVTPPPAPLVANVHTLTDAQLSDRLDRAKATALRELGIEDPAKAKAAIEAAKKAEDDAKTAAQKLGETSKTLETEKARADRLEAVVKERATAELGALTAEQQAAVRVIAPDADPAAQLRAITALAPTWKTSVPAPVVPPVVPPVAPPVTPPSGTAPPPVAPVQTPTSQPDHKAEYATLKAKNPQAAALYLNKHHAAIYPHS